MKFQRKKVAAALAYVVGAGGAVMLASTPAQAADIKVDVTGSNIKRVEGEGPVPVQVIGRQEIQNTGVQTAQDLLDKISANQSFGAINDQYGAGTSFYGFSGISLRGLGTTRTLVLMNGRRLAAYAQSNGSSVDLNSIPISVIERVEILKDGASAVYGADAIAGVVNFILRTDFQGYEAYGYYGDSYDGGGKNWRVNGTAGWGSLAKDKWNFWIAADYYQQDSLKATDRFRSSTAYIPGFIDRTSNRSIPANIDIPGVSATRNPTIPGTGATPASCLKPFSFPTTNSPRQCRFDFASTIDTIPDETKTNIVGKFTWQINPDNQFWVEANYYNADFIYRISPTPVSNDLLNFSTPISMQPTSPFYPAAYVTSLGGDPTKPISFRWRGVATGPRTDEPNSKFFRAVAGLQGNIKGWDYTLAGNYTENKQSDVYTDGYLSEQRLIPILNSAAFNPFSLTQTPAVQALLDAAKVKQFIQSAKATNYGFDGKVSNDIAKLPAGPLAMALGFEWHHESLQQYNDPVQSTGDIVGGAGQIPTLPEATRNVGSLFAEFNIPVVKDLEIGAAVRYDNYSDFGSTWNPKVTVRYQPTKTLLLRGSWGTGFRAPTLFDLFQPLTTTNTAGTWDDPIRCPVTANATDCNNQFNARQGGNPALKPEKSDQWNVGFVFDPIPQLSLGADYFWIKITDAISVVDDATIFNNYALLAPTNIFRKPSAPPYPNLPGEIAYVLENSLNQGKTQTSGIDVNATFRQPTDFGLFTLSGNGTYLVEYKQTTIGLPGFPNYVGTDSNGLGAIARWKHNVYLNWAYGPYAATLDQNYQSSYSQVCDQDPCDLRTVGSYSIWNLQGRYTGFKNTTLTVGAKNLFNTNPPFSNKGGGSFQTGYDPLYANILGLFFYGSVQYSFK